MESQNISEPFKSSQAWKVHRLVSTAIIVGWIFFCGQVDASAKEARAQAAEFAEEAAVLSKRGAFEDAGGKWKRAAELYQRADCSGDLIDCLIRLGDSWEATGQHRLASEALTKAVNLARKTSDRARLAEALSSLGAIDLFSRAGDSAEISLKEVLRLAR